MGLQELMFKLEKFCGFVELMIECVGFVLVLI